MKHKSLIQILLLILFLIPVPAFTGGWVPMNSGTTNPLNAVWGSSSKDVFAVGGYGTILHYDGTIWSLMNSGTTSDLIGVWGSSGTNVYAVGNGIILHYDGTSWLPDVVESTYPCNTIYSIWGDSATDIFAVGSGSVYIDKDVWLWAGVVLHYDGTRWSQLFFKDNTAFYDIWGTSGTDFFAVGGPSPMYQGPAIILHYDGASWSEFYFSGVINGIWGSSENIVFAISGEGILQYNGVFWVTILHSPCSFYDIWGSSGKNVFAVGSGSCIIHYDSTNWATMESGSTNSLYGVWGTSPADVFAVGNAGTILHYNGEEPTVCTTWTDLISRYNAYVSGQAQWNDVIDCYNQYATQ